MNVSCPPSCTTLSATVRKIVCLLNICLKKCMGQGYPCISNSWRSTKTDEIMPDLTGNLAVLGISDFAFWLITELWFCCVRDIRKCQELAQQTLVRPIRELRQMSVTLVLHAFSTGRLAIFVCTMDMERREEEHRQICRQKHPRCDMSLCYQVHNCKVMTFFFK